MRIGVISDTHGHFDPRINEVFAGVDHILHAGDVGSLEVLSELRLLAPVTAVLGNVDYWEMGLRPTERVELGGWQFLLHHIVNPRHLGEELKAQFSENQPDVLVFGHSHVRFQEMLGGVRFLNPGYAGKPRFNQPRSVAVLKIEGFALGCEFVPL